MMDIKRYKGDNVTYVKLREFGLEKTLSFARPISSAMFHEVIYPGGLDVTGRILVDRQSFEMCLSASDLCRFVVRSEEHTSELQSLMRISYAVFCLKKKNKKNITYD